METLMYIVGYLAIGTMLLAYSHYISWHKIKHILKTDGAKFWFNFAWIFAWPLLVPFMLFGFVYSFTILILSLFGGKAEW